MFMLEQVKSEHSNCLETDSLEKKNKKKPVGNEMQQKKGYRDWLLFQRISV